MDDEEKHSIEHLKELAQKEDADKLAQGVVDYIKDVLGDLCNQPGAIFYNGRSTLKTGDIYLMGLNPGDDPVENEETINKTLNKWMSDPANFSGYCDEAWSTHRKTYEKGKAPHQQHVKKLCKILCAKQESLDQEETSGKEKVRAVFSANAIFLRTQNVPQLLKTPKIRDLRERCWRAHRLFLQIVKPKLIVCLGNYLAQDRSSFSILREWLVNDKHDVSEIKEQKLQNTNPPRYVKQFVYKNTFWGGQCCLVVGVPHPSYPIPAQLWGFLLEPGNLSFPHPNPLPRE